MGQLIEIKSGHTARDHSEVPEQASLGNEDSGLGCELASTGEEDPLSDFEKPLSDVFFEYQAL